jgi:hypothetical protein
MPALEHVPAQPTRQQAFVSKHSSASIRQQAFVSKHSSASIMPPGSRAFIPSLMLKK